MMKALVQVVMLLMLPGALFAQGTLSTAPPSAEFALDGYQLLNVHRLLSVDARPKYAEITEAFSETEGVSEGMTALSDAVITVDSVPDTLPAREEPLRFSGMASGGGGGSGGSNATVGSKPRKRPGNVEPAMGNRSGGGRQPMRRPGMSGSVRPGRSSGTSAPRSGGHR